MDLRTLALPMIRGLSRSVDSGPTPNNRHCFILSTGRTGTTFLGRHFNTKQGTVAVHEPAPSWRLRLLSGARLEGMIEDRQLASHLRSLRHDLLEPDGPELYIESNPFLYGFGTAIPMVFPQATIIHIVRDPRRYVRSAIDHGNAHGIKHLFNQHVPFWTAQADRSTTDTPTTPLERLARYWGDINGLIAESATCDRYLCVRFEDLFSSLTSINEIEALLGVEVTNDESVLGERINRSPNRKADWEDWSLEEAQLVHELCGPLMKKFGYGEEPEWHDMIGQSPSS